MREAAILSPSQVGQYLKNMMDRDHLLSRLLVRGELSNYKMYPSGHHYFTLKDGEGALRCVMFRSDAVSLRFRPENGMRLVAFGRVTVYPRDGAYQLYCQELMQDGRGALDEAFEQLRRRLEAEGLFDEANKQPLPEYPGKIALVTSPAGAAVRDMLRILGARWPLAEVLVAPVRVQGAEAAGEIAAAIHRLNNRADIDLIITGRGGGSMEDLWAFNEENTAQAIYECATPIISAVGHETDTTIADYVADLRAPTPSAAAELAVYEYHILEEQMREYRFRMTRAVSRKVDHARLRLDHCRTGLRYLSPGSRLRERRKYAADLEEKLEQRMQDVLTGKRHQLALLSGALDGMSPVKKLSQGYAFVADESGQAVRDASQVTRGQTLDIHLLRGCLRAAVTGISLEEPAQREGEAWM